MDGLYQARKLVDYQDHRTLERKAMHSSSFKIKGYKGDVTVLHNGDWSGDAIIVFKVASYGDWDVQDKPEQRVTIPAPLLIALGKGVAFRALRDQVTGFLEQLPDISELPGEGASS